MPTIERLRADLAGRTLPGGSVHISHHESRIADHALHAPDDDSEFAHPAWLVIASLRGMGISVEELCDLAAKAPEDTLLFGSAEVSQERPMKIGMTYRTTADIGAVDRRTTRDGATLDSVVVTVRMLDDRDRSCGSVTSTYLFKRKPA